MFFRILCLAVAVSATGCLPYGDYPGASRNTEYNVTLAEYDQIEIGMTYKQVKEVIGADGEMVSEGESDTGKHASVKWTNADWSFVYVLFYQGEVRSKSQTGLK